MKRSNKDNNDDYDDFQPFPTYVLLGCGITVTLIGIYLLISNQLAEGVTSDKYGRGSQGISITGGGAIFVGFILLLFPVSELIKRRKKNKKDFK